MISTMRLCPVCEHQKAQEINGKLLEGVANGAIAQQYGVTTAQVERHRARGHAARAINQAILAAGESGALAPIASIAISAKSERLSKLQSLFDTCYKYVQVDDSNGVINHKLVAVAASILKHAAEEMGEWRPDGGKQAEATAKLAQSIIIHANTRLISPTTSPNDSQVIDITPVTGE